MEIFLWILFCILMIPVVVLLFIIVMSLIEDLPKNKADWLFAIAVYGWVAALIIVGSALFKGN